MGWNQGNTGPSEGISGAWLKKTGRNSVKVHNLTNESIIILGHNSGTMIGCAPSSGRVDLNYFIEELKKQPDFANGSKFSLRLLVNDRSAELNVVSAFTKNNISIRPRDGNEIENGTAQYDSTKLGPGKVLAFRLNKPDYYIY